MDLKKYKNKYINVMTVVSLCGILLSLTGCKNVVGNSDDNPDNYIYTESDEFSEDVSKKENSKASELSEKNNEESNNVSGSLEKRSESFDEKGTSVQEKSVNDSEESELSQNEEEFSYVTEEESTFSEESQSVPEEVIMIIEKCKTEGGVLDLQKMLVDDLGLEEAQMGLFDDNYSIAFSYNSFTKEEIPGAVFVYTRDGVMHYRRDADSSGNIAALFRNIDIIMSEEDILAIYNVFVNNDISGFYEI